MDWTWGGILIVILFLLVIFGSMRQHRLKKIISMDMIGGRGRGHSGSSGSFAGRSGAVGHTAPTGRHSGPTRTFDHQVDRRRFDHGRHPRYIGSPYYVDGGQTSDWWPGWFTSDYWWPQYDCVDYATQKCVGVPDYQSCFNSEMSNCQYV